MNATSFRRMPADHVAWAAFSRAALFLGFVALFLLAGCNDAKITNNPVATSTSGQADDGDPATAPAPATYPAGRNAADGATRAASDAPVFDQVGGNVHAILGAGSRQAAVAKSFNRVLTPFVVNKQNAFTFDIDLDVTALKVIAKGTVEARARANVLDANGAVIMQNGQPLPNTQITDVTFRFELDPNGKVHAVINGDAANPDPVPANNHYARRLSGPNGGITLPAGNYTIELELRLEAQAPVDPKSQAEIDSATAKMKLR